MSADIKNSKHSCFRIHNVALEVGEKAWSTKHCLQLALVSANINDFMNPATPLNIHVATEKLDLVSAKTRPGAPVLNLILIRILILSYILMRMTRIPRVLRGD